MRRWRMRKQKARPRTDAASILVGLEVTVVSAIGGNARFFSTAPGGFFSTRLIVAVVIRVIVVVLIVFEIDVVEHDAQHRSTDTENGLLHPCQHRARKTPMLNHDHSLIYFTRDHGSVAHAQDWWRIKEYDVVAHF